MTIPRYTVIAVAVAALHAYGAATGSGDFDSDGKDDLLLRHLHSDEWKYYTLVDDSPVEHELGLTTEPVWRFVATGDFDGNGHDDVLVRRYDTLEAAYHARTVSRVEVRPIRLTVNPPYDVLDAGDLDGDGADEILIRRNESFGAWLYYDVDGTRVTLQRNFGPTQNLDFEFAAIGDLDGDGRDDILARHRTRGHWIAYLMNGTERAALRRPRITQNLLFVLQGFADITSDSKADPILRNTTTGEWIYYATGNRVGTGHPIAMRLHRGLGMPRDGAWAVASIGDYDGDGRATPLLRDPLTGEWRLYDIDGKASEEVRFPPLPPELAWASVDTLPQDNPAQLAQVEFLQGPPVFRKDYRTGETIGPIAGGRPEDGAEPLEPQPGPFVAPRWLESNHGFVTAVWHRRLAIAVATEHPYAHPPPALAVRASPADGEAIALPVVYDVTEPAGAGYRTELVFDLAREMNAPGTAVDVVVSAADAERTERLALFGETVEETIMRWVPISTATVGAVDFLGDEGQPHLVAAQMPIGDYRSTVGDTLEYQVTGNEAEGTEFNHRDAWEQLKMHQTTHGCGPGETYIGIYNYAGMYAAGIDAGGSELGGTGVMLLAGTEGRTAPTHEGGGDGHEFAHAVGLGPHTNCPRHPDIAPRIGAYRYPYTDGILGPARGWLYPTSAFRQRGVSVSHGSYSDEPHDIMSYCAPVFVSDFTYQNVLTTMQAPFFRERMEDTRACLAERESTARAPHRSLAVMGRVNEDGSVAVIGMRASDQPPWPSPSATALPPGTRLWTLELLDAAGGVMHRQGIPVGVPDYPVGDHPDMLSVWSHRVAYPQGADAIVVRDPRGDLRTTTTIACPRCESLGVR